MEAFQNLIDISIWRVSSSQENTVHNKTFVVAPVQMILAPWWLYSLCFFLVSRSTNAHRFPHHLPAWYLFMHPSIQAILEWKVSLTGTTWVFIICLMCGARVYRGYNASAYGSFRHLLNLICQVTKMLRVIAVEYCMFHCWFNAKSVVVGIIFTEWIRDKVIVKSSAERGTQTANWLEIFSGAHRLQLAWICDWLKSSMETEIMTHLISFRNQIKFYIFSCSDHPSSNCWCNCKFSWYNYRGKHWIDSQCGLVEYSE